MMMRTKVFAEDSREAMIKINREIGEDAVFICEHYMPSSC